MSKQIIYMKHKDEVMLEIVRLQRLTFCDDQVEAEAVNHGKIQGLMWAANLMKSSKDDPFDQWSDEDKKDFMEDKPWLENTDEEEG